MSSLWSNLVGVIRLVIDLIESLLQTWDCFKGSELDHILVHNITALPSISPVVSSWRLIKSSITVISVCGIYSDALYSPTSSIRATLLFLLCVDVLYPILLKDPELESERKLVGSDWGVLYRKNFSKCSFRWSNSLMSGDASSDFWSCTAKFKGSAYTQFPLQLQHQGTNYLLAKLVGFSNVIPTSCESHRHTPQKRW